MTAFLILDVIFVVFQVMGQYLASGAQSADVTGDEPMFALGVSLSLLSPLHRSRFDPQYYR